MCIRRCILFFSQAGELITDFFWDFGDTQTSTSESPVHIYSNSGVYEVSLMVTATNGCQNEVTKERNIYNPPQVDFSMPSPTIACTNQAYTFENTSTYDVGSTPVWQWLVDNISQSSSQNGQLSFDMPVAHTVKLVASIPDVPLKWRKYFR